MLKGNSPPEVARGREGSHGFAWGRMGSNGLLNKTSAKIVKFRYTLEKENWGVHARP